MIYKKYHIICVYIYDIIVSLFFLTRSRIQQGNVARAFHCSAVVCFFKWCMCVCVCVGGVIAPS